MKLESVIKMEECKFIDEEGYCTSKEMCGGLCENIDDSCFIKQLFEKIEELDENIEELKSENENYDTDLDEANTEIEELNDTIGDLEGKIENSYIDFEEVKGYLKELDKDLNIYVRPSTRTLQEVCDDLLYIIAEIEEKEKWYNS